MHKKIFTYSAFILLIILALVCINRAYAASKITVTATVPASSNDAVVTLTSSPDNSTLLRQNDEVTFTVSYRSLLNYSTNFVLEASWQQGLISGGNYVDTFNYVLSSATYTDNGAVPVIDLQNRKITWTFVLAPSASAKTVTFKLKVRPDLPTTNTITVVTSAQGQIAGAYTASSSLQFTVQQLILPTDTPTPTPIPTDTPIPTNTPIPTITPTPTNTPTPGPTSTPAPNPTATPIPVTPTSAPPTPTAIPTTTPQKTVFKITNVTIDEVTNSHAQFSFTTSTDSSYTIKYGTDPTHLALSVHTDLFTTKHTVNLESLTENTKYFFTLFSTSREGKTVQSDVFTLQTARATETFEIKEENIKIIADSIPLNSKTSQTIILPFNQSFTVNLDIGQSKNISQIVLKIKNSQVLGITNTIAPAPIEQSQLIEINPAYFSTEIVPPAAAGTYELYLEIHTVDNSFFIKKLPYQIHISPPLKVYSSDDHSPVENAKVTLYKFEPSLNRYSALTSNFTIPYRTDQRGELPVMLPLGSYLIEVKSPGFFPIQHKFELSTNNFKYPEIALEPNTSLTGKIEYYSAAFYDSTEYVKLALRTYFSSKRIVDILMIVFVLDLCFIALAMLSIEAHVGILGVIYLPYLFFNNRFKQEHAHQYMQITVHEEGKQLKIISGVRVFVLNKSNKVIFKGSTSVIGRITIPKKLLTERGYPYTIRAYRAGYFAYPVTITSEQAESPYIRLWMSREYALGSWDHFFHWFIDRVVALLSNLIIIFIICSTVLILRFNGLETAFPFMLASISVTGMWGILLKTSLGVRSDE